MWGGGGGQFLPVIGHEKPEVTNVCSIFGQDDMASELARREPEGEIRWLTELELSVDPVRNGGC